jgi:hypothetical protein
LLSFAGQEKMMLSVSSAVVAKARREDSGPPPLSSRIPKRERRKILVRDIGGDRFEPESSASELGRHGHFLHEKQFVHVFGDVYFTIDENGKCRACEKGARCRAVLVTVLDLRPGVPVDWRALTTRDPSEILWLKEFNGIVKRCRRRVPDLTTEEIEELRKILQEVPRESRHAKVLKNYGETLEAASLASMWRWGKSENPAPVTAMTYQRDLTPDSGTCAPLPPEREEWVEEKTKTPTLRALCEKLCEDLKLVQWVPQKQVEEWIKEIIKRRG